MKIILFQLKIKMLLKCSFVLNPSSTDSSSSLTNKPWILFLLTGTCHCVYSSVTKCWSKTDSLHVPQLVTIGLGSVTPTAAAPFMKPKFVPPWNMQRLIDMSSLRTSLTTATMSVEESEINTLDSTYQVYKLSQSKSKSENNKPIA